MANRYWVGGTANWDGTALTKWATTSGGAGGASVPTSLDDVFFDANSTGTVTIVAGNTGAKSIDCTNFTGNIAGTAAITISGNITLVPTMGYTHTGTITITLGNSSIVTAGKAFSGLTVTNSGNTVILGDAFNISTRILTINAGTFDTANNNITASALISSGSSARTINLGSSTLTLSSGATPVDFGTSTNLTFNAGTSNIICNGGISTFAGGDRTFYDVNFMNSAISTVTLSGSNTFNKFLISRRATGGITKFEFSGNQIINSLVVEGTGADSRRRVALTSSTDLTQRTLTCNNISQLYDVDFMDINIAGNAVVSGPISGVRLGDGANNANITFDASKTVYFRSTGAASFSAALWSATEGGASNVLLAPLPQDTFIVPAGTYPISGVTLTLDYPYILGNVDLSRRTSNTLTIATTTAVPNYVVGDWINGSGISMSGATSLYWRGRRTQTIDSAGKSFTQTFFISSPGGDINLSNNLTTSSTLNFNAGNLNLNNYICTSSTFTSSTTGLIKGINFGDSGKIQVTSITNSATVWNQPTLTNFSYTGNSSIELTGATAAGTQIFVSHGTTAGGNEARAVSFNVTQGSGIIVFNSPSHVLNLEYANVFTGTMSFNGLGFIYGNYKASANANTSTAAAATSYTTFAKSSGTQTLNTYGKSFRNQITKQGAGNLVLNSDWVSENSNALILNAGTFDANIYNVTIGAFAANNTASARTLKMGSGTWTLNNVGNSTIAANIWRISTANLTFDKGTANIIYAAAPTLGAAFHGGGLEYNKLTIDATSPNYKFLITGNNIFSELSADTVTPWTLVFGNTATGRSNTTVGAWTISGNAGNIVSLRSGYMNTAGNILTTTTYSSQLTKYTLGNLSVQYMDIQASAAQPTNTWYSLLTDNNINNGFNTGWIFSLDTGSRNFFMFF